MLCFQDPALASSLKRAKWTMGTETWKSTPCSHTEPAPTTVPRQRLHSGNFHQLSAHTCCFPLSNLTFWYLTVSKVWHLKYLEEKQSAEAHGEMRMKANCLCWAVRSCWCKGHVGLPSLLPIPAVDDLEKILSPYQG